VTPEWMHVRTADGVAHAFRRRQDGGPRWIAACGARLWLPGWGRVRIDEIVDCMSCVVHEARR
jgi:hypothetical protein